MFVGTKKLVAQIALEKLQSFALRHALWRFRAQMYMFRHDAQFPDCHAMPYCCFCQNFFRKDFIPVLPQHSVTALRAPFQIVYVHAQLYVHDVSVQVLPFLLVSGEQSSRKLGRLVRGAKFCSLRIFFIFQIEMVSAELFISRAEVRRFLAQKINGLAEPVIKWGYPDLKTVLRLKKFDCVKVWAFWRMSRGLVYIVRGPVGSASKWD